jgi:hypothetical protein
MSNFNTDWWTEKEVTLLTNTLINNNCKIEALPLTTLAYKTGRTETAIIAKAKRILEKLYLWSSEEERGLFYYYLQGLPLAEIHDKLLDFGCKATMKQLEVKIKEMRQEVEEDIKDYAEERKLKTAKHFCLDTINFWLKNKNTDSEFTRKALHQRIKNG